MMRPSQAREGLQQRRADARLRRRDPRPVGVGRVAAEQQQALAPQLGEPRDVGRAAVDRGLVELVVAGHQHRAELGAEDRRARRRGSSAPCGRARARTGPAWTVSPARQDLERRVLELVLLELRAHHADRQQAAVDHRRHADLAQHEGQRADVVLVAVGEDDGLDVVGASRR